MSFERYDLVSLAEAREKRDTTRKQVANVIDPVEERKAQKLAQQLSAENSFEAICREWHANKADRWSCLRYCGELRSVERWRRPEKCGKDAVRFIAMRSSLVALNTILHLI